MMLNVGKDDARRMIGGAAYSYKNALQSSIALVPLQAFSDVHGLPAQRFFNLLCLSYGSDPQTFADIVEEKFLPPQRADDCPREYAQVAFAFQRLIEPHVDEGLKTQMWTRDWLPPATARVAQ
jgi:hypothetical protein